MGQANGREAEALHGTRSRTHSHTAPAPAPAPGHAAQARQAARSFPTTTVARVQARTSPRARATSNRPKPQEWPSTFDCGKLNPTGVYASTPQDYAHEIVKTLILSRRLAPFYQGVDDEDDCLGCFGGRVHPTECPICLLVYPSPLNRTRCCAQPICTECFVQARRPDPFQSASNPPESPPAACPFCMTTDFGVLYTPPRALLDGVAIDAPPTGDEGSREASGTVQRGIDTANPHVVTVDEIRPGWEAQLEAARAARSRRSNRRIIMRNVGGRLVPVAISSSRTGATLPGTAVGPNEGGNQGPIVLPGTRIPNQEDVLGAGQLEQAMLMEAIRQSLLDHQQEEQRRAETQQRADQEQDQQLQATHGEPVPPPAVDTTLSSDDEPLATHLRQRSEPAAVPAEPAHTDSSPAPQAQVSTAPAVAERGSSEPEDESNVQWADAEQDLPIEPTPADVAPEPSTVSPPTTNLPAPTTATDTVPTPVTTTMDERTMIHDNVEHEHPTSPVTQPPSSSSSYDTFADLDPPAPPAPSAPSAPLTAADMQASHVPLPAVADTQPSHASAPITTTTTSSMDEPMITPSAPTEAPQNTSLEQPISSPAPATADQETPPAQTFMLDPFASLSLWGEGERNSSPEAEEPDPFHDNPSGTTTSFSSAEQAAPPLAPQPSDPWPTPLHSHLLPSVPIHTSRHSEDISVPLRSSTDVPPRTASVPLSVPRPSLPSLSPGSQPEWSTQPRKDTNPFRRGGFGTATPPVHPSTQATRPAASSEFGLYVSGTGNRQMQPVHATSMGTMLFSNAAHLRDSGSGTGAESSPMPHATAVPTYAPSQPQWATLPYAISTAQSDAWNRIQSPNRSGTPGNGYNPFRNA